ncbi:MAG: thioesterase family protein [Myxococcales bacterium]|nr:thioesterase family protein [Myxococcales bacterium]MCB9715513.1 thioesterase family protein [Myxococcales bacterium]
MSSFGEVISWAADGPGAWTGSIPTTWMQGRTSFGGIPAALGLRAIRAVTADDQRRPRSVHTSFFGPLDDRPARVTAEVIRAGRYLSHARAEIRQAGELRTQVTVTLAADRDSGVVLGGPPRPERKGPEGLSDLPFIDGLTPAFTRYFAFRWTDGSLPFSGGKEARLGGWCRHRSDPGPDPYVAALGLLDAWPSPFVSMMTRPAPASSVTWTTNFFDVPEVIDESTWCWYGSEGVAARNGIAGMRAGLHGPEGRLVATVEQLVALFDRPGAGPGAGLGGGSAGS